MRHKNGAESWIACSVQRGQSLRAAVPRLLALLALLALGACATTPPSDDLDAVEEFRATNDALEPVNRALYDVNSVINRMLIGPLGYGYRRAVPEPLRNAIRSALDNASSPVDIADHLLEGKPCRAGDTLLRLAINTTLGLGGLIDQAREMRIPAHRTDFGLTLGRWGVPSGPYLYLPVLGSSNPRDLVGSGVDLAADPWSWIVSGRMIDDPDWIRIGLDATDSAEHWLDQVRDINRTSLDPYVIYRSMYNQHRLYAVERTRDDDSGVVCGDPP